MNRPSSSSRQGFAVLLITVASANVVAGSVSGSLRGVVRDQQGAVIAGATVEIACGDDHRRTVTVASGEFSLSSLPVATCTVTARSPLFKSESASVNVTGDTTALTLVLTARPYVVEVTVTPTRGVEQDTFDVPLSLSVVSRRQIDTRPYQLLPQVLREEPGILLQQTTSAQASPIIRGFTGQSNVYLVDGVRLNTAAWRGGPSQYLGWLDAGAADRIEIVRGPGSTQYGSDALGGTINVLTAQPGFSMQGIQVSGSVEGDAGLADGSRDGQADLQIRGAAAAFRVGMSTRRIDDLRTGQGLDSHSALTRFLGLPSTVLYSRLPGTSFEQQGGYVTGNILAGDQATLTTTYMHERQRGVDRYDRMMGGDGLYLSGFDPQTLDLGLLRYRRLSTAGFDDVSATFSVNRQGDGRFEQTRPTAVLDSQRQTTTAYGYQLEGRRHAGSHQQLSIGAEFYDETISASRRQFNPLTSISQAARPDIADRTGYTTFGAFVQDVADVVPGRLSLQGGLRFGRYLFTTTADPTLGVTPERVAMQAVTFQTGAVVRLLDQLNLTLAANRGFRAANAADLGSIGLSGGGGFEIAPSAAAALGGLVGSTGTSTAVSTGQSIPQLGPEVLYSFESGLKFRSNRLSASVTAFDLEYLNTIQRRSIVFASDVVGTTISGYQVVRQDAAGLAYIAQDVRPIGTRVNLDHARMLGVEAEIGVRAGRGWTTRAYFSMTDGHLLSTGEYLRRMPPPLGGGSVRWSTANDRRWVEGVVSVAAAQTRFNSGDVSDARIGALRTRTSIASFFNGTAADLGLVQGGVLLATGETLTQVQNRVLGSATSAPLFTSQPGFIVFGLRAGWRLSSALDMTVIGENLTDRNYRPYGSGLDAAGRSVQVRLRYRFCGMGCQGTPQ